MPKKILITGASEGIGRAFAKAFVQQGDTIVAVARSEERLKSLVQELGANKASYLVADLSTADGVKKIVQALQRTPFDILINNAGFGGLGEFTASPADHYQKMLNLNIDALVRLSHTFLKTARPGDALVNVASVLAFLPSPYHGVYAATKAFVKSFSESLWFEQKKNNVYVMALCPGSTVTEFNERAGASAERIPKIMQQTSEQVVTATLRELGRRRKPVVVSGLLNQIITQLSRITPTKTLLASVGRANAKATKNR